MGACWGWSGQKNQLGYGQVLTMISGRRYAWGAHRVSWMLANGAEIPAGMLVMHMCDNPGCLNPKHLELGRAVDNTRDAIAKGRADPDLLGRHVRGVTGAAHPASRYTRAQRAEAMRLRYDEGLSYAEVCARVGCGNQTLVRWNKQHLESLVAEAKAADLSRDPR